MGLAYISGQPFFHNFFSRAKGFLLLRPRWRRTRTDQEDYIGLYKLNKNNFPFFISIRNKWGCGNIKSKWCDYHLRVAYKQRTFFLHTLNIAVGKLAPYDKKWYWQLRKVKITFMAVYLSILY